MIETLDFIEIVMAAILIAVASAPLGCLVIWQRMAYFGDSLAHGSLLGVSLGIVLGINLNLSIFIICIIFAFSFTAIKRKMTLPSDTILGILAHASLSLAIIILSVYSSEEIELHDFLFGDIFSLSKSELYLIIPCTLIILGITYLIWNKIVLISINEDLAKAEGVRTSFYNAIFILLLTMIIAISIRTIGIILISSLLLIPPATGRIYVNSHRKMAVAAALFGGLSALIGVILSSSIDTPTGPSIVLMSSIIFITLIIVKTLKNIRNN